MGLELGEARSLRGGAEGLGRGGQNLPPVWITLALSFPQGIASLKGQRKCAGEALCSPPLLGWLQSSDLGAKSQQIGAAVV